MHRVVVALAVSLAVAGCGAIGPSQYPEGGPMKHMANDMSVQADRPCTPEVWITGVVTPNAQGFAAIRDADGKLSNLVWRITNTATVEWGRRYRIGGRWYSGIDEFWACGEADSVIPQ